LRALPLTYAGAVTASRSALIALLLALLVRAGIPTGYMLAPGDGLPRIVPCAGIAPKPDHRRHRSGDRSGETPCPFAVVVHAGLPGAPPSLAPAPPPFAPRFVPVARAGSPRLPASLRPPATGPPFA